MTNVVHYKLPFGALGAWVGGTLVRKRLDEIFTHRRKALDKMFGKDV